MPRTHGIEVAVFDVLGTMRTAHVHRPGGDSPKETDAFDWRADGLAELAAALAPAA